MKNRIIILLIFIPLISFSQNYNKTKEVQERYNYFFNYNTTDCAKSVEYAQYDVDNETLILYTSAGMIVINEKLSKKLKNYQEKHEIAFPNFGCVAPNYKCVAEYNNHIFTHLKLKYGEDWLKKTDEDVNLYMEKYVIGFAEFKTKLNKK